MTTKYSKLEIEGWPEDSKCCNVCGSIQHVSNFTKDKKLLFGVSASCRRCINETDRGWTNFTKEDIDSWGVNKKKCKTCQNIKSFSEFHKTKHQLLGLNGECKACRKENSKVEWESKKFQPRKKENLDFKKVIVRRAKSRAKKAGIPFNIDESDIVLPEKCPVLGMPFIYGDRNWTFSIDKIVPALGYVKGNVIIVSNRANIIKNNATPEEILAVGFFYKNLSA
jgi:hypothetical protein